MEEKGQEKKKEKESKHKPYFLEYIPGLDGIPASIISRTNTSFEINNCLGIYSRKYCNQDHQQVLTI